ncbi:MAG: hypothetical protein HN469_07065 [Candidatus Marinimicrobia bacterium]|jgi:hypothetical protein|nr:hypothetical protein [Candidatus Neomarinimicrobiota bacterium]MBT4154844.1 hypothetical protein [Candidatus Neomarinimicrobiota bacterium]
MKQMKNISLLLILTLGILQPVKAQSITLTGDIYEYATYYVNSFDLNTGATNVQIFRYQLESDQYPIEVKIRFTASMRSPSLGINDPTTIIEIVTGLFDLQASLILDNRDISSETSIIYDMGSPPNQIDLTGQVIESLDPSEADAILQSVLTTGRIADGEYTFKIQVESHPNIDRVYASDFKTIIVQSPVSINLETPGGVLTDTLDNLIYSNFPIFQWFSQSCNGCNSFIRVAQYNSGVHSSLEDALEDQRVLPFNQSDNWHPIENVNSYQYPFSGAYPLEPGNVYAWQIMITLPTTSGFEEMASSIFAFKIGIAGTVETANSISSPLLMTLQQALGDDQYNAFFGSGNELQGYNPSGQLLINGVNVDEASVNYILNQFLSNNYQINSITVE